MIVEAPRGCPVTVATAAERIPIGSKPAFCQNVLSSVLVVASMTTGGIWSYGVIVRLIAPKRASSIVPVRS